MDPATAQRFYNVSGVTPGNDPESDESSFAIERIRDQLLREVFPGARALDLGCGAGRFTFALEQMGADVTGIDCASAPLDHARKVAQRRRSTAGFVEGDVCNLSFGGASFDLALLPGNNLVEFSYEDIDRLAGSLRFILVKGGRFCVEMNDGVEQPSGMASAIAAYDVSTGLVDGAYDIPGHGPVPYSTYFWTIGFARHIISRNLDPVRQEALGCGRYWFVFQNRRNLCSASWTGSRAEGGL